MDTPTPPSPKTRPKSQCSKCQALIADSHMERHQKSDTCRHRYLKNILAEKTRGLVRIDNKWQRAYSELTELANHGAIPGAVIYGYNFEAYVPEWIDRAMRLYISNKGYAGMTFLDFLKVLGPEETIDLMEGESVLKQDEEPQIIVKPIEE